MVQVIKVKVKGKAPLLMNRFNPVPDTSSKRKKKVYDPEEEAEKKCYRTSKEELFIPSTHFKASMIKAATDFIMKGKKTYKDYIKSGVFVSPEEIILDQQEYEIHAEPVVINRSRVMSWRPKFKQWSCSFEITIEDDLIAKEVLKEILESAGNWKAVGDHRPEYGRFEIVEFKLKKE